MTGTKYIGMDMHKEIGAQRRGQEGQVEIRRNLPVENRNGLIVDSRKKTRTIYRTLVWTGAQGSGRVNKYSYGIGGRRRHALIPAQSKKVMPRFGCGHTLQNTYYERESV